MDDLECELGRLEATLPATRSRVIDEVASMRQELACGSDGSGPFKLANVRIASPCKERWGDMLGDDRVRVCNGCDRPVFDLSEMTRSQAEAVLATRGITPCVRFYRRTDGTVMTSDCPPGARRSRRLAVVAAGTALLGSSTAMADPPATPAQDPPTLTDEELAALAAQQDEPEMGILIMDPSEIEPAHTTLEWSTWVRGGVGIASQAPDVAARGITQPMTKTVGTGEAALGADTSVSIASDGDLRLGGWGEMRTTSGPVLGGELIVAGLPPHPSLRDLSGAGNIVLRVGANEHVITAALGIGYAGAFYRTDPWIRFASEAAGAHVVVSTTYSRDTHDWSAMLGLEIDPIGAARYLIRRVSGDE